jgi:hypothetical protein
MFLGDGAGASASGPRTARESAAAAGMPVHHRLPDRFRWVRTPPNADVTFVDLDRLTAAHFGDALALTGDAVGKRNVAGMLRPAGSVPEELRRLSSSKVWAKKEGRYAGDG